MINAMISPDLSGQFAQLKADLIADANAKAAAANAARNSQTATLQTDLADITTVNGQISTEVQAINSHTSAELAALSLSPIKHVYRVTRSGDGTITIPAVDITKTVVNLATSAYASQSGSYGGHRSTLNATLTDATTLTVDGANIYYYDNGSNRIQKVTVVIEVIEYA